VSDISIDCRRRNGPKDAEECSRTIEAGAPSIRFFLANGWETNTLNLQRNKNASSAKQDVVMEFYGLPPIGQKQRRPMDGAQLHSPWVVEAGGRLRSHDLAEVGDA
jgi:hypothetical protein